jgi:hypothetical protein
MHLWVGANLVIASPFPRLGFAIVSGLRADRYQLRGQRTAETMIVRGG